MTRLRVLAIAGLVVIAGAFLAACGGDGDGPEPSAGETATTAPGTTPGASATPQRPPPSTGGTAGGPDPILPQPAARYTVQLDDLPANRYEPYPPNTYLVGAERFELLGQFASGLYAASKVLEWNYVEGWNAEYIPLARLSALVDGGYYLTVETYLFSEQSGAHEAYESFLAQYRRTPGSLEEQTLPLGNESTAFSLITGTVGRSDMPQIYHRFIFRRGNLIGIVQTTGAEPYMSIDIARDYAVIIDSRALGIIPPELPTPIPTPGG